MTRRFHFNASLIRSCLIALIALAFCAGDVTRVAAQQSDLGWAQTRWRPDANQVLAVLQGESIDQESVYLWQLVNGRDPLVARISEGDLDTPSARRPLQDAIREYAIARLLSREAGTVGMTRIDLAGKATRIFAGDAAMLAYADLMIAPHIRVDPADVRHFYRNNANLFVRPARVEVLELLISANPAEGEAAFQAAIARALELRTEALTADGLLTVLERNPQLSTESPIGRTRVFREGDPGISTAMWSDLSNLRVTQISQPIRTETAVLLYELVNRVPEQRRPIDSVRNEITRTLERRSYITQLEVALERERTDARPLNQTQFYHLLEPEMTLLRVRGFALSRGEFDSIFPQLAGTGERESQRRRRAMTNHIVRGETMTQALERDRLLAAPFYQRALAISRTRVQAENRARALQAEFQVSDDDVRAYVEANPERFAPDRTRFVWRLEFAPAGDVPISLAERDRLAAQGMQMLASMALDGRRLLEERAAITGDVAYTSPHLVVNRLLPADPDLPYTITFTQVGELTSWQARERGASFDRWAVGNFSETLLMPGGRVAKYYAADEIEQAPPPMARQLSEAREVLLRDSGRFAARQRLEDLERTASFSFRF